jgi:beta-N-acetylhexosaminidase
LWVGFDGQVAPPGLLSRIREGEVGATILFARNLSGIDALVALTSALHAAAPEGAPLLIAVDQEGGRVQRVRAPATVWPPMARLGRLAARDLPRAEALAEQVGRAMGAELAALGFDIDFAPVLDVHTNPQNPVIGDRAFATTPEHVATLAGAFAKGLSHAGILPCGKHFPGHGDTALDSHLELPSVDHPLSRLRAVELLPFRALPDLPILMTAHVVFPALDPHVPATLSEKVLETLLRQELGYRGVVVSDDLEMKAIADHFGLEEAIERALLAGCDAFLLCHLEELQRRAFDALVLAAERKSAVAGRVAEAAARVLALKRRYPPPRLTTVSEALAILGKSEPLLAALASIG